MGNREIYALGEIDADAGNRLDALMNEKIVSDGSVLYLDSPGANFKEGMELGRTIRKHHLTADIARKSDHYTRWRRRIDYIFRTRSSDLLRIGVINNGSQKTVWTLRRLDSGLYLEGQRETVNGINKFMIGCLLAPRGHFCL
jgi:hypothetical protein